MKNTVTNSAFILFFAATVLITADAGAQTHQSTTAGIEFTRDRSIRAFHEAWRDPRGILWGDVVINEDGSLATMEHQEATDHCRDIGGRLPSEEDFRYLIAAMGGRSAYAPQVLPHLDGGFLYWSSSCLGTTPCELTNTFYFVSQTGAYYLNNDIRGRSYQSLHVRCVARRRERR